MLIFFTNMLANLDGNYYSNDKYHLYFLLFFFFLMEYNKTSMTSMYNRKEKNHSADNPHVFPPNKTRQRTQRLQKLLNFLSSH